MSSFTISLVLPPLVKNDDLLKSGKVSKSGSKEKKRNAEMEEAESIFLFSEISSYSDRAVTYANYKDSMLMIKSILVVICLVAISTGYRQVFVTSNRTTVKLITSKSQSLETTQEDVDWNQNQCLYGSSYNYRWTSRQYWKFIDLPPPWQIFAEGGRKTYSNYSSYFLQFADFPLRYESLFLLDLVQQVSAKIFVACYWSCQIYLNGQYCFNNTFYTNSINLPERSILPRVVNNLTILFPYSYHFPQPPVFFYIFKEWGTKNNTATVIAEIIGPILFLIMIILVIGCYLSEDSKLQEKIVKEVNTFELSNSLEFFRMGREKNPIEE